MYEIVDLIGLIRHPTRNRIIGCLHEIGGVSFSELLSSIAIEEDHGKFGYHLRILVLHGVVECDASKKYHLTEKGHLIGELIWDAQSLISRELDLTHEPNRYVRHLKLGDHTILFYDTEDFKRGITYQFLLAALLKGEAVVYIVPEDKLTSEVLEIRGYGINSDNFNNEAFTIMSAEEWYMKKGKANAETIIANWRSLLRQKGEAGFKGLYVAGETNVFFDYAESEELLRYEEMVNNQFPLNMCALCLCDANKIDENQFIQLYRSHVHAVFKGIAMKTK